MFITAQYFTVSLAWCSWIPDSYILLPIQYLHVEVEVCQTQHTQNWTHDVLSQTWSAYILLQKNRWWSHPFQGSSKNLGVLLDPSSTLTFHMQHTSKPIIWLYRQIISRIWTLLTNSCATSLAQDTVSLSPWIAANGLFTGCPDSALSPFNDSTRGDSIKP